MPKSKTIEIDEIITPENSGAEVHGSRNHSSASSSGGSTSAPPRGNPGKNGTEDANPFADFHQSLPWRARITLRLTQWFLLLRAKSWGKLVIIPIVILAVMIAIPLVFIAFILMVILMALRSIFSPRDTR